MEDDIDSEEGLNRDEKLYHKQLRDIKDNHPIAEKEKARLRDLISETDKARSN